MKRIFPFVSIIVLSVLAACNGQKETNKASEMEVEVQNTLDISRASGTITISLEELEASFPEAEAYAVYSGMQEIPHQLIKEGPNAGLMILIEEIEAEETQKLTVKGISKDSASSFPKRTQAELSIKEGGEWKGREYIGGSFKNVDSLRVPDEHTDHSWYIRYEGPGWESDLVGYRFYLDWRNATDVFGKTTTDMVLQNAGQDGFDSYHELSDWGMDVLKVGKSLGIGSPAYFDGEKAIRIDSTDSINSKILANGAIYSSVKTNYYGWSVSDKKLDITSFYSIHAGSRLTHHHIDFEGNTDNLATGIGKADSAKIYTSKGSSEAFGYIVTYGRQSLNNDKLGLAVLFPSEALKQITADQYSDIVVLTPQHNAVDYYFLAAWELEKEGITTEEDFLKYVENTARELASPLVVTIKK
ncbi:DUF4861 family protein [Marivirga lumbricoides]|uniref:DUF4861 family protein n=1 Tax=Marivirga lumbricoides TaxID=1046115 RepID=UPI001668E017